MTTSTSFTETPVSWIVEDIQVNATLTHPQGEGVFPAIVMVAGSGPTDRDWNTPLLPGTNGSAALLADRLTRLGYITLRYDKRATGPQAQENMLRLQGKVSMLGHRLELAGGVHLLAGRPDVDPNRIFVLTNSEGALHALNYQTQDPAIPFAGMILTSAPARPVGAVARMQIAAQLGAVPGGDQLLAQYDAAIAEFSAGREVQISDSLPEGMAMLLKALTAPFNQPFSRELWLTDAAQTLGTVDCPVLIVLGKKDIQVDWQADGSVFDAIAQRKHNIQVVYLENANHVLKVELKPRAELNPVEVSTSYNAADAELSPEAVAAITGWLKGI